jgi:hypothetical protein
MVYFDRPRGNGQDVKFEIVSAGDRLHQSLCFQKSAGRLTCVTGHNPHVSISAGEEAARKQIARSAGLITLSSRRRRMTLRTLTASTVHA